MRAPILILAISIASCGLSYQQRQDRFREHYLTGCQVLRNADPKFSSSSDPALDQSISSTVEDSRPQLQNCYAEALAVWPQLEGRLVLDFIIQPDGTVGETAVAMQHSTVFDPSIGCCFARVAQTWRFPRPPEAKPLVVEYPFEVVTDILKVRFSSSVVAADSFKSRFTATVILAPPQAASGTELHNVW